ncbi:MAG: protein kinase domain-containing protein [Microcoleus sp.]
MNNFDEQILEEESINYCINPKCQQRQNPEGLENCLACNTPLLINNRYRAVKMLYQKDRTEIFELQDLVFGAAGWEFPKILKVLTDDRDPNLVRLFQQEELILRGLKHHGIPKVFPGGYFTVEISCDTLLHCLAMEQIHGDNLEELLKSYGKISERQAIDWLKQIAKILEYVHGKGFFHRDIKPSNIMCRPDGSLVLIDFGAASSITSDTYIDRYENRSTTQIISCGYTAPEQENCAAIPKSDLFALGRTFVHLLTGDRPNNLPTTATRKLIWRELAPQISVNLADLIDEMIAVESQHRPQNPSTVLQRLARIECGHLTILNFFRQAANQNRYMGLNRIDYRLAGVGVCVSLLLGIMAFKLFAPRWAVALNNRAADRYEANKFDEAQFYLNLALFLNPNLGEAHYIQGTIFDDTQQVRSARNSYEKALEKVPEKALNNLARLDILEKRYATAIPRLEKGLQLVKQVDVKSALHKNLGWALLEMGDYQQAQKHLNEAIALDPDRAAAYCLLGQVREVQKDSSGALTALQSCLRYAPNEKYQPELEKWLIQARQRLEVGGN